MDGGEMKEMKGVTAQWWAGTRGHWRPTEQIWWAVPGDDRRQKTKPTAEPATNSQQRQPQKGRKIRVGKRKNKFLNQKEGRDVQLLSSWSGCGGFAASQFQEQVLQEKSSRSKSSIPCTAFPCRTSGAFKKSPKEVGLQAKAVTVLPPVILAGERGNKKEQFISQPGFAGHEKAKILVGETNWRGRNKWRAEINPVRVWGTRMDTVQEGEQTLSRSFADPYSQLFPHFSLQQFKCCQKVKWEWFPRIVYKFRGTLSFPEIFGWQRSWIGQVYPDSFFGGEGIVFTGIYSLSCPPTSLLDWNLPVVGAEGHGKVNLEVGILDGLCQPWPSEWKIAGILSNKKGRGTI